MSRSLLLATVIRSAARRRFKAASDFLDFTPRLHRARRRDCPVDERHAAGRNAHKSRETAKSQIGSYVKLTHTPIKKRIPNSHS
jgi:hypothetical protein